MSSLQTENIYIGGKQIIQIVPLPFLRLENYNLTGLQDKRWLYNFVPYYYYLILYLIIRYIVYRYMY